MMKSVHLTLKESVDGQFRINEATPKTMFRSVDNNVQSAEGTAVMIHPRSHPHHAALSIATANIVFLSWFWFVQRLRSLVQQVLQLKNLGHLYEMMGTDIAHRVIVR